MCAAHLQLNDVEILQILMSCRMTMFGLHTKLTHSYHEPFKTNKAIKSYYFATSIGVHFYAAFCCCFFFLLAHAFTWQIFVCPRLMYMVYLNGPLFILIILHFFSDLFFGEFFRLCFVNCCSFRIKLTCLKSI